mmetsp:Transcript_62859/g.150128  ORF Transcript_62859/g.150128 Transcript_62859/m.150128 type:complete len:259 (-) Transcript_62859:7-783(-)
MPLQQRCCAFVSPAASCRHGPERVDELLGWLRTRDLLRLRGSICPNHEVRHSAHAKLLPDPELLLHLCCGQGLVSDQLVAIQARCHRRLLQLLRVVGRLLLCKVGVEQGLSCLVLGSSPTLPVGFGEDSVRIEGAAHQALLREGIGQSHCIELAFHPVAHLLHFFLALAELVRIGLHLAGRLVGCLGIQLIWQPAHFKVDVRELLHGSLQIALPDPAEGSDDVADHVDHDLLLCRHCSRLARAVAGHFRREGFRGTHA